MQYFVIIFLLVCAAVSLSHSINLCDLDVDSNFTSYKSSKLENCGCQQELCIRKCCKPGYYLAGRRVCRKVSNNVTFVVPVYKEKTTFSKNVSNFNNFAVGVLECKYYSLNNSDENDSYFAQENGMLWLSYQDGLFLKNSEYCIDELDGLSAFLCFPEEKELVVLGRIFNMLGMVISIPFLLATFLVYAVLPDRNVHQRALMFYVLTLCMAYTLLVTINSSRYLANPWCEIIGYATLFFFMASFFWMNVICFDIWYTFCGGRGFVGSRGAPERKMFMIYSAYAWGVPFFHVILVFTLQNVLPLKSVHNPGVGVEKCFIGERWPSLWYFYGEAAILIIANITFFLHTALKIRQVKKETAILEQNDGKRHSYEKQQQKFNLYLRLLFAMGLNWSMEVISALVSWQTDNAHAEIWFVTDFLNALYGVFIFFMFVFNKKIWKLLQERYYRFVGRPQANPSTQTSLSSTTSCSTSHISLKERTNGASGEKPEEMAGTCNKGYIKDD